MVDWTRLDACCTRILVVVSRNQVHNSINSRKKNVCVCVYVWMSMRTNWWWHGMMMTLTITSVSAVDTRTEEGQQTLVRYKVLCNNGILTQIAVRSEIFKSIFMALRHTNVNIYDASIINNKHNNGWTRQHNINNTVPHRSCNFCELRCQQRWDVNAWHRPHESYVSLFVIKKGEKILLYKKNDLFFTKQTFENTHSDRE